MFATSALRACGGDGRAGGWIAAGVFLLQAVQIGLPKLVAVEPEIVEQIPGVKPAVVTIRKDRPDRVVPDRLNTVDADISLALDIPMNQLKTQVAELSASGDVICCKVTRFIDGKKIEGTSCRLSCDLPAPARGIIGTTPDVDKVMRRFDSDRPSPSDAMASAVLTLSKL